jgi:hypothetical protein
MSDEDIHNLRVLIANEKRERLELLAKVVTGLGHEGIAHEAEVRVGSRSRLQQPGRAGVAWDGRLRWLFA